MTTSGQDRQVHELDAVEVAETVRRGNLTAAEVVEHSLERIAERNGDLNAFVFVDGERARRVAKEVDARVAAGDDPGPLAGVPLGIKELECVEGWPDTRASTAYADRIATTTTTMTSRLLAAGAVPVGLTASPEIGHLPYTTSVLHGPTRNPWNTELTPGGSSGGSAAAVAAGLVPLATGSDMGGSIRIPSGWCGTVGVKGTFGRIPRGPGWLGGANLVHYGPLARSVRDAALFLDCTAGVDHGDPASLPAPEVGFERALDETHLGGLTVAVVDDVGMAPSDPDVATALRSAADALIDALGWTQRTDVGLTMPEIDATVAALVVADADPAMADALPTIMANLYATDGAEPLMSMAFGAVDLSLEGVAAAHRLRHEINTQLAAAFDEVDVLLLPTSPVPAFGCRGPLPTIVAGREVGPAACVAFTSPFNLSGHPVVAVPMGTVGLAPVGMQIVTARHRDALALGVAAAHERVRPWPKQV